MCQGMTTAGYVITIVQTIHCISETPRVNIQDMRAHHLSSVFPLRLNSPSAPTIRTGKYTKVMSTHPSKCRLQKHSNGYQGPHRSTYPCNQHEPYLHQ